METENNSIWYSSHGHMMTTLRFVELEVLDRKNYTNEEVIEYFKQNGIVFSSDLRCIWVTKDDKIARSYNDNPKDNIYAIDTSNGTVIHNFDDGDGGFLYVDTVPLLMIDRATFIKWYYNPDDKLNELIDREKLIQGLSTDGVFIINAKELLENCQYIPKHLVENKEQYPKVDPTGFDCILVTRN